MTIPNRPDTRLALLELVRVGRPANPAEMKARVERHFPLLTDEDRAVLRKDGITPVWRHTIAFARNDLRDGGVLQATERGTWSANDQAKTLLSERLVERGMEAAKVDSFVRSGQSLASVLGRDWAEPLRIRIGRRASATRQITGVPRATQPIAPEPNARPVVAPASDLSTLQQREIEALRKELLDRLNSMDAYDFEQFVARILEGLGFSEAVVVGRSGDEGVDIQCKLQNKLLAVTVAVQVKRQQGNVGPKEISYLRDRWARRADKLLFVTTSGFTAGAREVAEDEDSKPVLLVDGEQLADTMIQAQIGVVPRAVTRFELDPEFFGE